MIIKLPSTTKISLLNGKSLGSAELEDKVNSIACTLIESGVKPRDTVAIIASYDPDFFSILFGAWRVGACVACVNASITSSELETICEFTNVRTVIGLGPAPFQVSENLLYLDGLSAPSAGVGNSLSGVTTLEDNALILFTSGTTGIPKGVTHTFRSLLARIAINRAEVGDEILRNTLCPLPTHFGHGLIGNCLTALFSGGHLLLVPGVQVTIAASFGQIIDEHKISFMSSVPAMWRVITRLSKPPVQGTLKRVHVGSAPLPVELWAEIGRWAKTDSVWNMYGITETCNWLGGRSYVRGVVQDGDIGRPWFGSYAVKKENGEIALNGKGELLVQSPSLMKEYFKQPDKSKEVLQGGWFYTGDVAEIDDLGNAKLIGRIKNEINRAGLKIHPEDIDLLLERHEQVREVCTFGLEDELAGQLVGVAIVPEGNDFDIKEIKSYCRQHLIAEKNPERWFVVAEIPKTDRGKVNRQNVANYCLSHF